MRTKYLDMQIGCSQFNFNKFYYQIAHPLQLLNTENVFASRSPLSHAGPANCLACFPPSTGQASGRLPIHRVDSF